MRFFIAAIAAFYGLAALPLALADCGNNQCRCCTTSETTYNGNGELTGSTTYNNGYKIPLGPNCVCVPPTDRESISGAGSAVREAIVRAVVGDGRTEWLMEILGISSYKLSANNNATKPTSLTINSNTMEDGAAKLKLEDVHQKRTDGAEHHQVTVMEHQEGGERTADGDKSKSELKESERASVMWVTTMADDLQRLPQELYDEVYGLVVSDVPRASNIKIDNAYKSPMALQITSKSRKQAFQVYYGTNTFTFASLDLFRQWMTALSLDCSLLLKTVHCNGPQRASTASPPATAIASRLLKSMASMEEILGPLQEKLHPEFVLWQEFIGYEPIGTWLKTTVISIDGDGWSPEGCKFSILARGRLIDV
ncbi:unnamed protein product [Zymoseptoria tritici ST99CH_1E4]|nr:unnamed protein product [Zymoseptoria tritici ST99CH_1E4]